MNLPRRSWMLALALVALPTFAVADTPPSAWDRARDPAVGERYRLHLRVQELLHPIGPSIPPLRERFNEQARALLEGASARTSPDVRLRFDLGEVYEALDRYQEAFDVLEPALAMAPGDVRSASAWRTFAFAAAHLDRSETEVLAYDRALALSMDARPEYSVLANRAEAEMRLGHLEEAITGYRDVIDAIEHGRAAAGTDYDALVLARWGLAVALDRHRDFAAAEQEATTAAQEDPDERIIGDREHVFFVPAYERDWYFGLGRAEHARRETSPRAALLRWEGVVEAWADYVGRASKDDRWLALAHAHLESAVAQRDAAVARVRGHSPVRRGAPPRESSLRSERR